MSTENETGKAPVEKKGAGFMDSVIKDAKKLKTLSYEDADEKSKSKAGRKKLKEEDKKKPTTVFFSPEQLELLTKASDLEALEINTLIIRAAVKDARKIIADHEAAPE